MSAINTLTSSVIDSLCKVLQSPGQDALQTLRVCGPVLIEQLKQLPERAVDRRELAPQIRSILENWLQQHPQPEDARSRLIAAFDEFSRQSC